MTYFEDLRIGTRDEIGSHTFTAEEIKAFAREFDPQPFHLDEAAAAASHFGALCASGWHTAAICLRLMVDDRQRRQDELRRRGEPVAKTGPSPGLREVKWPRPVYVGDTVTFAHEIVELRDVQRPGVGLRVARNTGTNQRGELVYSVLSSSFIERRDKGSSAGLPHIADRCGQDRAQTSATTFRHSCLSGLELQQDSRYVVRLRAAGFEQPHVRQQLMQQRRAAKIRVSHQFDDPGLAEEGSRGGHRFGDAVGENEELVSRPQVYGGRRVSGVFHQSERQPACGLEQFHRAVGATQERRHMTGANISQVGLSSPSKAAISRVTNMQLELPAASVALTRRAASCGARNRRAASGRAAMPLNEA